MKISYEILYFICTICFIPQNWIVASEGTGDKSPVPSLCQLVPLVGTKEVPNEKHHRIAT